MNPRLLVFLTTQITSAVSTVVLPVCCVKDKVGFANGCSENFTDTESVFEGKWKNYDVEWSFNKSLPCVDLIHYEDQNVRIDGKGNLFVTCSDGWCCGNECAVRHAGLNDEKNEYCMDYSKGTLLAVVCDNSMPISNSSNGTSVEETSTFWLKNPGIGNTCTIISIIALIATCLLILTDDTKSQEDYVLYVVSQSVAQILMLISSVIDCSPRNSKCWQCLLKGYSLQYLGLSAFFWMNATSLQMRVNLSQKRTESTRKLLRWREFKIFSLYAWGTPLLISAATYWLQMSQILDGFCSLKPDISVTTCFLRSTAPLLIYFYGPATIILVINTILFGIVASILAKIKVKQKRLLKKKTTG
ncbi:hypothetical protein GE061_018492 [Apolygus lucorum]|uniref:G-protein coupled receptors family 2 profile 2 domain-containing protein n=1 Tax=Apolygus lucorum TaxID=248454 RepID=A0A8S9XG32_APOLU|nr:hypothetical protein GE061_018492 [Apolygus lucorum]